jgi:hypothetical protein
VVFARLLELVPGAQAAGVQTRPPAREVDVSVWGALPAGAAGSAVLFVAVRQSVSEAAVEGGGEGEGGQ